MGNMYCTGERCHVSRPFKETWKHFICLYCGKKYIKKRKISTSGGVDKKEKKDAKTDP